MRYCVADRDYNETDKQNKEDTVHVCLCKTTVKQEETVASLAVTDCNSCTNASMKVGVGVFDKSM